MTEPIHPSAARGYETAADIYERGRPGYPNDAVAAIAAALDLRPGRTVLELGAGTGKLTRLLTPSGAQVLALEPVEAMRAVLVETAPAARSVAGAAEDIPLPNGSVDGVVVAQAFHWFDGIRALSEIHRVLRPGGRLVIVWNRRDASVAWVRAMGDAMHLLEDGEPQVRDNGWRATLDRSALFGGWQSQTYRLEHRLSPEGVLERAASVSYVAAAAPDVQTQLRKQITAILAADPLTAGQAEVGLPYETEVLWAERAAPVPGAIGIVASVNANRGGVPKPPVDGARVGRLGLHNDAHHEVEPIHGGPDGAVCLYAQEAIERVRTDGHQAFPGAFGENLTLVGIEWAALTAGDRLTIGEGGPDALLLELVKHATPCGTIAHWFVDRRIARISAKVNPQDARWYARVLREGDVAPGMGVHVERGPAAAS